MSLPDKNSKKEILKKIISSIKDLPPYPDVIFKAKQLINNDNTGLGDISDIILKDPALSARVLKLANSSYYSIQGGVGSIKYASQILGIETLIQILETASMSAMFNTSLEAYDMSPRQVWRHSLFVATAAKKISELYHQSFEADAYTAGLLHECGKILLSRFLNDYKLIFADFIQSGLSEAEAETKILGINHAQVGYAILKTWNFPHHILMATRDHHKPMFSDDEKFTKILSLANMIALFSPGEEPGPSHDFETLKNLSESLDMDINNIIEISSQAHEFTEEICSSLI